MDYKRSELLHFTVTTSCVHCAKTRTWGRAPHYWTGQVLSLAAISLLETGKTKWFSMTTEHRKQHLKKMADASILCNSLFPLYHWVWAIFPQLWVLKIELLGHITNTQQTSWGTSFVQVISLLNFFLGLTGILQCWAILESDFMGNNLMIKITYKHYTHKTHTKHTQNHAQNRAYYVTGPWRIFPGEKPGYEAATAALSTHGLGYSLYADLEIYSTLYQHVAC